MQTQQIIPNPQLQQHLPPQQQVGQPIQILPQSPGLQGFSTPNVNAPGNVPIGQFQQNYPADYPYNMQHIGASLPVINSGQQQPIVNSSNQPQNEVAEAPLISFD